MIKGGGMNKLTMKRMFSSILSFSSADNRLINDSVNLLEYLNVNTDDAICSYQVCLCTWAPNGKKLYLKTVLLFYLELYKVGDRVTYLW